MLAPKPETLYVMSRRNNKTKIGFAIYRIQDKSPSAIISDDYKRSGILTLQDFISLALASRTFEIFIEKPKRCIFVGKKTPV